MPRRRSEAQLASVANARVEKDGKKVRLQSDTCSYATSAFGDEDTPLQVSSSGRKLGAANAAIPAADGMEQEFSIVSVHQLTKLICEVLCPECLEPGLDVSVMERNADGNKENRGFANKLQLRCSGCGYGRMGMSSPKENNAEQKNKPFEVNTRMALFSHEIGASHASLQKFGAVLGMPAPVLTSFQAADKRITEAEVEAAEEALFQSANHIRKAYAEVDPDPQETIDITVSFDGTWQKRGFTSLYGVGVVIDVLTGLVVDFHVMSKYCHACKLQEAQNFPAEEMEAWRAAHAPKCCRNHHASSKAMEQEAAKVLWGRSVRSHNFRYTEMLCDGYSSAFKAVVELDPYPGVQVEKLDCINHAHKRMGSAVPSGSWPRISDWVAKEWGALQKENATACKIIIGGPSLTIWTISTGCVPQCGQPSSTACRQMRGHITTGALPLLTPGASTRKPSSLAKSLQLTRTTPATPTWLLKLPRRWCLSSGGCQMRHRTLTSP
ncbi:uncharacterized protein [Littorina saxatilis]|uniref:uncharacterized protein n=1 Tax=Littorina saxatilis TaxID=31220 RepID=UPI0038B64A6C